MTHFLKLEYTSSEVEHIVEKLRTPIVSGALEAFVYEAPIEYKINTSEFSTQQVSAITMAIDVVSKLTGFIFTPITGEIAEESEKSKLLFRRETPEEISSSRSIDYAYRPTSGDQIDGKYYTTTGVVRVSEYISNHNTPSQFLEQVSIFIHEIGHFLGLNHPGSYNGGNEDSLPPKEDSNDSLEMSIMSYFIPGDGYGPNGTSGDVRYDLSFMMADVLALHEKYSHYASLQSHSINGGNTTYSPDPVNSTTAAEYDTTLLPVQLQGKTLYDDGGIDTITTYTEDPTSPYNLPLSVASITTPEGTVNIHSIINLNEGGISSVGGGHRNLFIAHGSVIENVDARGANDTNHTNDAIFGNAAENLLHAGHGQNLVYGGDGNDLLTGGSGSDTLYGDDDHDILIGTFEGTDGDHLYGGSGQDILIGGLGADSLDGGADPDLLFGFRGQDTLTGGGGTDIFSIAQGLEHTVTITDITPEDVLDIEIGAIFSNYDNYQHYRRILAHVQWVEDNPNVDPEGHTTVPHGYSPHYTQSLAQNLANPGAFADTFQVNIVTFSPEGATIHLDGLGKVLLQGITTTAQFSALTIETREEDFQEALADNLGGLMIQGTHALDHLFPFFPSDDEEGEGGGGHHRQGHPEEPAAQEGRSLLLAQSPTTATPALHTHSPAAEGAAEALWGPDTTPYAQTSSSTAHPSDNATTPMIGTGPDVFPDTTLAQRPNDAEDTVACILRTHTTPVEDGAAPYNTGTNTGTEPAETYTTDLWI